MDSAAQPEPPPSPVAPTGGGPAAACAAAVVASSAGLAAFTLVADPENPRIALLSPRRLALEATLRDIGLFDLLHLPTVQATLFALLFSAGAAAWLLGMRRLRGRRGGAGLVVGTAAAALVLQVVAWPTWSTDAFLYSLHARVASVHGANPYGVAATDLPGVCVPPSVGRATLRTGPACRSDDDCGAGLHCGKDLYLWLTPWGKQPAAYGPLAVGVARAAYDSAHGIWGNAVVLRAWAAVALLVAGALLIPWAGAAAAAGLLWSPLAWLIVGNGGHLEAWTVLLLAVLLHPAVRVRISAGAVCGALGLIKPTALLVAPPVAALIWRRRGAGAALGFSILAALVLAAGYAAVWADPHPFGGLLAEASKSTRSPVHLLRMGGRWLSGYDPLDALKLVGLCGFGLWLGRQSLRLRDAPEALALLGAAWLAATVVVVPIFQPWHALPVLFCGLLPGVAAPLRRAALALALLAPLVGFGAFLLVRAYPQWAVALTTVAIFAPPLALWWRSGPTFDDGVVVDQVGR